MTKKVVLIVWCLLIGAMNAYAQSCGESINEIKAYYDVHILDADPIEGLWECTVSYGGEKGKKRIYLLTRGSYHRRLNGVLKIAENVPIIYGMIEDAERGISWGMAGCMERIPGSLSYNITCLKPYGGAYTAQTQLDDTWSSFFFQAQTEKKGTLRVSAKKIYPTPDMYLEALRPKSWTGPGFALLRGYVVTNHHVVDGAKSIAVRGVDGNHSVAYNAEVVAVDSKNDLAILLIKDARFKGYGTPPYRINSNVQGTGTETFVLGYPMTAVLGNEIKLTNGVVSSKTGYQGDITCYQISAPVHPGNSGGPMFNNNGEIIGVVNAGIPDADNVGYAIKTLYLKNLIEAYGLTNILPQGSVQSKVLTSMTKSISPFVFLIECDAK